MSDELKMIGVELDEGCNVAWIEFLRMLESKMPDGQIGALARISFNAGFLMGFKFAVKMAKEPT